MELEIRVDRKRCIGSGQCVHFAPGVFAQDEEAISVVVDPRGEPEDRIVRAVCRCPVQAISLSIDQVRVDTRHLDAWHLGSLADVPVASTLAALGEEHEVLRGTLAAMRRGTSAAHTTPDASPQWQELVLGFAQSLSDHAARERDDAYPVLSTLVGTPLVAAFDRSHRAIGTLSRALVASATGSPAASTALDELADALTSHVRLEETVLFPLALGVLASGEPPQMVEVQGP